MVTKQSYDWLRHIEKALVDLDEIPLMGHMPPFDFEGFCEKLKELLQIPDLEIEANHWSWHTHETVEENLGEDFTKVNIAVLPIQGHTTLAVPKKDLESFVSWVVEHKKGSGKVISPQFSEGLFNFLIMESLHLAQPFPLFKNFMLRILGEVEKVSTRSLVLDIKLKAFKEELFLKLIVPELFRKQWLKHFSQKIKGHFSIPHSLELLCNLEAGRVQMSSKEWKKVKKGDFIPLRSASLDLKNNTGSLRLSVGQKPLYRLRIKSNGLKIMEQPVYEEESQPMENDHDDLLSEISDLEQEKKQTLDPIPEESEEVIDDESTDNSLDLTRDSTEEEKIAVKEESSSLEKVEMVPMNVIVEVTRFKMTCEKLIQLKPGNLLELDVSLDKPVSLVINGKKIATGELVRIGDSLGVQVTEVG